MLVDGAVAGLGAVLGEMHKEGLFSAASADGVSSFFCSSVAAEDGSGRSDHWVLPRAVVCCERLTEISGPRWRTFDLFS